VQTCPACGQENPDGFPERRLLAAERGAPPAELGRARDYFAEQGAGGLLRRCDELLPASA
jgi:hypothetical protein